MRATLDLLLPPACPGCGREGEVLCAPCRKPLSRRLDEPPGWPLGMPVTLPEGLLQLEWCASFSGPVRAAVHALKYRGERRLAAPLGAAMAERWRRAGRGGELLVPVPVHPARRRERGFDQAEDLARACAARLGLQMAVVLERRLRTQAQHALGRAERTLNVSEAFGLRARGAETVAGRWVILIDDVSTTGATLSGCARALHDGGALAVSGLTLARER